MSDTPQETEKHAVAPQSQELTLASGVFYRRWDVASPKAVALIVHGLGEHSGRYEHVAAALASRGIAAVAPDHLGHGHSPGHRSHIGSFEEFFAPLDELLAIMEREFVEVPRFIIGHSMGGLIAGNYLLQRQERFAGAVFSGAAFEVAEPPSGAAIFINRILAALFPRLGVLQLDASEVSRDAEVVRRYREDPLVHSGKVSASLVVALFSAMGTLVEQRTTLTLPVLVMHGEGDVMTAPVGSAHFHEALASSDKTLRMYPGLYHEIFNEPEQGQVLRELGDWLDAHIPEQ